MMQDRYQSESRERDLIPIATFAIPMTAAIAVEAQAHFTPRGPIRHHTLSHMGTVKELKTILNLVKTLHIF